MMNNDFIELYLSRINYSGNIAPTIECLRALQRAHLLSVPFEDLDIHLGNTLSLSLDHLISKIITSKRGGFCYELNYLFGNLLRTLGFEVDFIAGQVHDQDGNVGDYFDHMALFVNRQWLADVGFGGGSFLYPLVIFEPEPQNDTAGIYKIQRLTENTFQLLRAQGEPQSFEPMYNFDLKPQEITNFYQACHQKQVDPQSHFVKNKICTLATEQGRVSLLNDVFTQKIGGIKEMINVSDIDMEKRILKDYFSIIV